MVLASASVAAAQPDTAPSKGHPATCDGQAVVQHLKRAKRLLRDAYALERWESGPKRSLIAKAQEHRRCIDPPRTRRQISDYRDKLKARLQEHAAEQRVIAQQWGSCEHNPPAASQSVRDCIHGASLEYGVAESWLLRIAVCESHLDPRAYNPSGASGLFQFMPSTFASTPYGGESIWSAQSSSLAAAWMFRQGRAGEWSCN